VSPSHSRLEQEKCTACLLLLVKFPVADEQLQLQPPQVGSSRSCGYDQQCDEHFQLWRHGDVNTVGKPW
jgi:hypothetical protein